MEGVSSGKDILFEESLYRDLDGRGGEVVDTVGGRVRFLVGVTLQEPLQTRQCESFVCMRQTHNLGTLPRAAPPFPAFFLRRPPRCPLA